MVAATALVVALLAGTIGLLHPGYESGDDAAMALYAAGVAIGDTPDAHLLFMHAWIGWLLSRLYTIWPAGPWYAILLYAALAFANLIALHVLLRRQRATAGMFLLFLVLFAVNLGAFAQELQFTTVAMYCTAVGWLAATAHAMDRDSQGQDGLVAVLALVLGASVRSIGFVFASLLCVPLVLWGWKASTRTGRRRLAVVVIAAGGAYAILHGLNAAYYRADPAWAGFYEYNALRANFNDYQVIRYDERTRRAFEAVGWSKNDYLMIRSWFHADANTFSAEKMQQIVTQAGQYGTNVLSLETSRRVYRAFVTQPWAGAVIIVGWIGVVRGFHHVGPVVLSLTTAAGLIVAVSTLLKPMPPRMSMAMAGLCALSAAFLAAPCLRSTSRPRWRAILSVVLMLAVTGYAVWSVARDVRRAGAREQHQRAFEEDMRQLAPRPSELYVAWAEAFPMKYIDPLAPFTQLRGMRILPLGTELGTPYVAGTMRAFRIDNLYLALASRSDIFLISDENKNRLYVDYMREKYRLDVTLRPTFQGRTFAVYVVESK